MPIEFEGLLIATDYQFLMGLSGLISGLLFFVIISRGL